MRDKGLDTFMMVLLTVSGIAILVMAWAQPMSLPERIGATFIGLIGLSWLLARLVSFISTRSKIDVRKQLPDVEVQKNR